ncbi:MAG: hypothetical protein K0U38_00955, partial [Epsilonproteobacteria bacterium]|nr:hypothetical protein [Campylobacterota bacterium]
SIKVTAFGVIGSRGVMGSRGLMGSKEEMVLGVMIMNKLWLPIVVILTLAGCGSNSKSGERVDLVQYLPQMNMTKEYTEVQKEDIDIDHNDYTETITIGSNTVTTKVDGSPTQIVTYSNDEINLQLIGDKNRTKIMTRHARVGDTVIEYVQRDITDILTVGSQQVGEQTTKLEETCIFESILNEYTIYFYQYENYDENHDIVKLKCTTKTIVDTQVDVEYVDAVTYENGTIESKDNTSYIYLQKELGHIATIDNDCITSQDPDVINDTASEKECVYEQYHHTLYHHTY